MTLYDYIKIKRRYTRSVNLERDLEVADSVNGYILTPKTTTNIERFFKALLTPNAVRAWTITGAYGTGKSAFAHFLSSLCSSKDEDIYSNALNILKTTNTTYLKHINNFHNRGLIKAVVTAEREPIAKTILRGLKRGVEKYWSGVRGVKPEALKQLNSLYNIINDKDIDNKLILDLIKDISAKSKTGLLIIVDELGKNLEYTAQNQSMSDLYILQQIAELPTGSQHPTVFFIGLLHQSFFDYSNTLTSTLRNEWAKIQGRFEDIPFTESPERVMYLIGSAIDHSESKDIAPLIESWADKWRTALNKHAFFHNITTAELSSIYPLHPISAISLPILSNKFSQNNRTLFTFLASDEPHSFTSFLKTSTKNNNQTTSFQLHLLYDYFVESAGISISARPRLQRWVEIQGRISDAGNLDSDSIKVLKTIGILNLVSTTGALRASRNLSSLAMCDDVSNKKEISHCNHIIDGLIEKGFITWRKQIDELRIWEGTDFNIEKEVSAYIQQIRKPLADMLNEFHPMRPVIARRHSYTTGTLRYFERIYLESISDRISCSSNDYDGLICYLLNENLTLKKIPAFTDDGKPLIVIKVADVEGLRLACNELTGLKNVEKYSKQLQSDGVARRELNQRIFLSEQMLDNALSRSFDITSDKVKCWILAKNEKISSDTLLNSRLSDTCDEAYSKGLHLWNELINRRELTSQGAQARRKLIEAMINHFGKERLGIVGNGPESTMFSSVLSATGIYSYKKGEWIICIPDKNSGVYHTWKEIESFCKSATDSPKQVGELYKRLESPPYGVKQGVIPILLLAVFLYYNDYVSIYIDGTYIPILGSEHFELLVKKPERFSVKYFEITGLRAQIFKELEQIVSRPLNTHTKNLRNTTLLRIVNPLVRFIKRLPSYTLKTESLSDEAKTIRKAILEAREPDKLLFVSLPHACGLPFIDINASLNSNMLKSFRNTLIHILQELQTSYDNLLNHSQKLLYNAFSIRSSIENLREDLRVRATYLKGQVIEPGLKSFIYAAINRKNEDKNWLESILMVIADKPSESWTDNDVVIFETKLSDIARRFKNIEFIQKELSSMPKEGFDVQKVTVTYPDGEEINEVVWLEHEIQDKINEMALSIFENEGIENDYKMKRALVAAMLRNAFAEEEIESDIIQYKKKDKRYA